MGKFVIHPDQLSDITFNLNGSSVGSDYAIGQNSIDMNENGRISVLYGADSAAGTRENLVPITFTAVVFGTDQADAMGNYRTLCQAISHPLGGTIEYIPDGLTGVMSTYYHYIQSPSPTILPGALTDEQSGRYAQQGVTSGSRAIVCRVQMVTKPWATSDPSTYASIKTSTAINNEGTSVLVASTAIKGDHVLPRLDIEGSMTGSDDILKNAIIYKKKVRPSDTSELEWVEGEDMGNGKFEKSLLCAVTWNSDIATTNYPMDITNDLWNAAAEISGGHMQSAGEDLRVMVDGEDVDRWLQDINSSTAQVWVNLDFEPRITAYLNEYLFSNSNQTSFEIVSSEGYTYGSLDDLPTANGLLCISVATDFEVVKYDHFDPNTGIVSGVHRGYGSAVDVWSPGTTVHWLQHEIWILHGNDSMEAPITDDRYKPIIELDSTNHVWTYQEFGSNGGLRTGAWEKEASQGSPEFYTANHGTNADPWEELGIECPDAAAALQGRMYLHSPLRITQANFTNGEIYAYATPANCDARIQSKEEDDTTWTDEYTIPDPVSADSWESWSRDEAIGAVTNPTYVCIYFAFATSQGYLEAADCEIDFNANDYPGIFFVSGGFDLTWTPTVDAEFSGGDYTEFDATSQPFAWIRIQGSDLTGIDRTYVGKIAPIMIVSVSGGFGSGGGSVDISCRVYASPLGDPVYVTEPVTLEAREDEYDLACVILPEIDFPPYPIPEYVAEADIDSYTSGAEIEFYFETSQYNTNIYLDAVCLAKADEWISHIYNAVSDYGLQTTSTDRFLVDCVVPMVYLAGPSDNYIKEILNRDGVPEQDLRLESGYSHRIRVFGFRDSDTLLYDPEYTFNIVVTGIYRTIYPFEEA